MVQTPSDTEHSSEADQMNLEMIAAVRQDLQELPVIRDDWTTTLCSAPATIGMLGECLLIASMKNAARVELDDRGEGLQVAIHVMIARLTISDTRTLQPICTNAINSEQLLSRKHISAWPRYRLMLTRL